MNIVPHITITERMIADAQKADAMLLETMITMKAQDSQLKAIQDTLNAAGVACWCGDRQLTIPERVALALGKVGKG